MRLDDYPYEDEYWINLFYQMHTLGIDIHHTSIEYSSYTRYCKILKKFLSRYPDKDIKHIVKLAEPNFKDASFCSYRISDKIDQYIETLGVSSLHIVQWMWRGNLDNDRLRVDNFLSETRFIKEFTMESSHKIFFDYFYLFPYSKEFAIASLDQDFIEGLLVYRNPVEQDFNFIIEKYFQKQKKVITIRPFFGGKVFKSGYQKKDIKEYIFNTNAVDKTIVSISRVEQLDLFKRD